MEKFKMVFRNIRGRIIPIKVAVGRELPDEMQKIVHAQKARKFARENVLDPLSGAFWKVAKEQAKKTGKDVARRMGKIKKKKPAPVYWDNIRKKLGSRG